ncbi:MAG: HipA family kinase, partial [Rhodanobacteraceae bacterium]
RLAEVDTALAARLDADAIERIVALIPSAWLAADAPFADAGAHRAAYAAWLMRRLEQPRAFVEEAIRARSRHL